MDSSLPFILTHTDDRMKYERTHTRARESNCRTARRETVESNRGTICILKFALGIHSNHVPHIMPHTTNEEWLLHGFVYQKSQHTRAVVTLHLT